MVRLTQAAILVAGAALCLLSLAACTDEEDPTFNVVGKVFCDVCRADFVNKLSRPIGGATVKLECRNETTDEVTYALEGQTDDKGSYKLTVEGNHEDMCQVLLVSSSRPDCTDLPEVSGALVKLTANNVSEEITCHAIPLIFNAKQTAPQCAELFKEMEFVPEEPKAASEVKPGGDK